MTNPSQTAPEADEKTIQRLRDALAFDHRDHEMLGPSTTMRLAFAVCNRLGLIPRSTEQAEVFLNAMRAAGQLTQAEVSAAKWELLGEEHSAGHNFAPDDDTEKQGDLKYTLKVTVNRDGLWLQIVASDKFIFTQLLGSLDKYDSGLRARFYNTIVTGEQVLNLTVDDLVKPGHRASDLMEMARSYRLSQEELRVEIGRLKEFREGFLSALSRFNLLADSLRERNYPDEG